MSQDGAAAGRSRPTMRQVAAAAGVSVATVSNALNGTGRLSESTRQTVLEAIERLSYLPFTTARAGGRGGTGVLGLTMTVHGEGPDYTAIPYYAQLILGTIAAAQKRGYLLVVLPASLPAWQWLATPLDGVILCEPRREDPVAEILRRRGIALVSAGRPPVPRHGDAWVDTDDTVAAFALLDHLSEAGARKIGAVFPDHDDAYPGVVAAAYRAWCAKHDREPMIETFVPLPHYEASERAACARLWRRGPDAAFGIYTASGHHLLSEARQLGIAVPAQALVACFSEDPAYAWTQPAITTVSTAPQRVGAEAVDLLLALLDARRGVRRQRLLPASMTVRASTAGPAAPHPS